MQTHDTDFSVRKSHFKHPVKKEDVELIVERVFGLKAKLINYHIRPFSDEKLGFLGAHYNLVVTIRKNDAAETKTHTFFLKSVPFDNKLQASLIEKCRAFHKENTFYEKILPELLDSVKDKSWAAQCYLVKSDAVVFEDLKSRNFVMKDKILDTVHLKSALSGLAKLHASSILSEKRLGKSILELYPEALEESMFTLYGGFAPWFHSGANVAVAIAKSLGLDSTSIHRIFHRIFKLISVSKDKQNVVCHGDAWSNNLMFDDSKPLPTCIPVDYQLVRYAPAMVDVVQLIYLTTERKYREEHVTDLLKQYNDVFCETLEDNGLEIDAQSNFHEVQQDYEEMRLVGIVSAALYFPIGQIEGKLAAELAKDSEGFSRLIFEERSDLVLSLMQKDPYYNRRVSEVIVEMVQRSEQLLAERIAS